MIVVHSQKIDFLFYCAFELFYASYIQMSCVERLIMIHDELKRRTALHYHLAISIRVPLLLLLISVPLY